MVWASTEGSATALTDLEMPGVSALLENCPKRFVIDLDVKTFNCLLERPLGVKV